MFTIRTHIGRSPGRPASTCNLLDKPTLANGPPMKLSVVDNQLAHDLLEIYVFNKSPFETAQVYSSSAPVRLSIGTSMCLVRAHVKVLKFTGQGYSSSLLVSFTTPFETVIESRSSIG